MHIAELRSATAPPARRCRSRRLDAGAERRSLSLRGELTQDLAKLWGDRRQLQGRGARLGAAARRQRQPPRCFHTLAAVRIAGADVELPSAGVEIESMDGEIPITADLVVDADGMHLLQVVDDQRLLRAALRRPAPAAQPRRASSRRRASPRRSSRIAPLAGNLRVDDNIVSLNQLELGVRGGRVTGQCNVEWRGGADATVQAHVRASGVEVVARRALRRQRRASSSRRASAASTGAPRSCASASATCSICSICDDPHHTDAAVNRVRRALALGYPEHVRLTFNHGFAAAKIDFGGLARLIRVDELRGMPMGPLIDRALAPLGRKDEEEE